MVGVVVRGSKIPAGIQTLGFLLKCKGKSDNCKWFKFLVFLNDDEIPKSPPHAAVFDLVLWDLEEALGGRHLNIIFKNLGKILRTVSISFHLFIRGHY